MQSSPAAVATLRTLLRTQPLAVLATQRGGHPYSSLVAFAVSEDLRCVVFVTSRATTKYRNLSEEPYVSLLIDSRTHSVEDFTTGAAVTVLGRAAEIGDKRKSELLKGFLLAHDQAEFLLLAVDFEGFEDVLLMRQQRRLAGEIERMMFLAEV